MCVAQSDRLLSIKFLRKETTRLLRPQSRLLYKRMALQICQLGVSKIPAYFLLSTPGRIRDLLCSEIEEKTLPQPSLVHDREMYEVE